MGFGGPDDGLPDYTVRDLKQTNRNLRRKIRAQKEIIKKLEQEIKNLKKSLRRKSRN